MMDDRDHVATKHVVIQTDIIINTKTPLLYYRSLYNKSLNYDQIPVDYTTR